jgi:hypothetical protein
LKQAEALATVEPQQMSTLALSEALSEVEKMPAKIPVVMSNEQTTAELFNLMRQELAKVVGPQAETILCERVAALGESMDSFPKRRLYDLLETLSKEIKNEQLRIGFRKWFVKHV